MRQAFFFLLLIGVVPLCFGQLIVRPIEPTGGSAQALRTSDLPPILLPFWDDFSSSSNHPGDLWEFSENILITESQAANPPSYKAATLDGVDANGRAYNALSTFAGPADQLISRRIDLSGSVNDESIYLSFFWESGGNVERPEDHGDSLRLQFLNADSSWVTVWKVHGPSVSVTWVFQQEIIKVTSDYRHENFRFKFQSFGSQQGPFDAWHVDYVYANTGRSPSDTFYDDQAMTGAITSLVAPFFEIPASHFFINPDSVIANQSFMSYNLDDDAIETLSVRYNLTLSDHTGQIDFIDPPTQELNLIGAQSINVDTLDANWTGNTDEVFDKISINPLNPAPDSIHLFTKLFSNFTDEYSVNDTIRMTQTFHDYYAYDDGSAEFAAGVAQSGSVAVKFIIGTLDTLTHIDIYFPTIAPSPVGKTVEINIWGSLEDDDPLQTQRITVVDSLLNSFTRVQLSRPMILNKDTIFIGYKQKTSEFLGVGLDRNNISASDQMYYRSGGQWIQNQKVHGILMIRPVFQYAVTVGVKNNYLPVIYPNPTAGTIKIGGAHDQIKVWTLTGKLVLKDQAKESYNLSSLTDGVYLLEVIYKGQSSTSRILLERN